MKPTRPVPEAAPATGRVVARLAAFAGVSMVAVFVAPSFLYPFFQAASALAGTQLIAYPAISCAALVVGTALTLRWFNESWGEATRLGVAARGRWRLLSGLAAGWLAIAVPVGVLIWTGAMAIVPADPGSWWAAAGLAAAMIVPAALTEELMFRGYALTLLQRAWGARVAIPVTSVAFGVMHLLNPGVSVRSVLIVTLAGAFLAVVRLAFDSLWSAWMAHVAYNFVQLAVFHTSVSGIALPQPGYRTVSTGPEWLTGGAWGPEAGAAAALGMFVISFLLAVRAGWVQVHRRGWRVAIDVRPTGRREP